jgi:hypothetical protein
MTSGEHAQSAEEISNAMRHRARVFRRARIVVLALVIGYFFLPYDVRAWIPIWLPFFAALGLEVHFFVGGYLQSNRGRHPARPDRGPQPRDLADLGGEHWRETHAVELDGEEHFVPTEGLADEEETRERIAAYVIDPEATLAAAAAETARPLEPPHASRRFVIEAVLAVALVAGILFYASRPHGWDAVSTAHRVRAEAVFSREATKIAGHAASVRCDTSGEYVGVVQEADGLAFVGGRRAYLTPSICNTLYQLAFKHRVQSFPGTGRAIAVLAHESWHLHGVADEGLTNCYAFQSGVQLGVDLGLSEGTARAMMREQLATNGSDSEGDPRYLVPSGCRNGGVDDLHPAASSFP